MKGKPKPPTPPCLLCMLVSCWVRLVFVFVRIHVGVHVIEGACFLVCVGVRLRVLFCLRVGLEWSGVVSGLASGRGGVVLE